MNFFIIQQSTSSIVDIFKKKLSVNRFIFTQDMQKKHIVYLQDISANICNTVSRIIPEDY